MKTNKNLSFVNVVILLGVTSGAAFAGNTVNLAGSKDPFADAARAGFTCPSGFYARGIDEAGKPICGVFSAKRDDQLTALEGVGDWCEPSFGEGDWQVRCSDPKFPAVKTFSSRTDWSKGQLRAEVTCYNPTTKEVAPKPVVAPWSRITPCRRGENFLAFGGHTYTLGCPDDRIMVGLAQDNRGEFKQVAQVVCRKDGAKDTVVELPESSSQAFITDKKHHDGYIYGQDGKWGKGASWTSACEDGLLAGVGQEQGYKPIIYCRQP